MMNLNSVPEIRREDLFCSKGSGQLSADCHVLIGVTGKQVKVRRRNGGFVVYTIKDEKYDKEGEFMFWLFGADDPTCPDLVVFND